MITMTKPPIGTKYLTAEINPVGCCRFTCTTCEAAGWKHIIELPEAAVFPKCKECQQAVTWRLESYM